jgi:hypothetical protein
VRNVPAPEAIKQAAQPVAKNAPGKSQVAKLTGKFVVVPDQAAMRTPDGDGQPVAADNQSGLANVFIYVPSGSAHPQLLGDSEPRHGEASIVIDASGRFSEKAVCIQEGQSLVIINSYKDWLEVYTGTSASTSWTAPAGGILALPPFAKSDRPYQLFLNRGPYLSSVFVLVQNHPFMAVTDVNGNFEMTNLPTKPTEFLAYHVQAGDIKGGSFPNPACKPNKFGFEIALRADTNDIGVVTIPESDLTRGKGSFSLSPPRFLRSFFER